MKPERRALELIDFVYRAPTEPDSWHGFVEGLSAELGGAAVALSLSFPQFTPGARSYSVGFDLGITDRFVLQLQSGLPWSSGFATVFVGRFGRANEVFPDECVADTDVYREWMEPQGLAACGPISHTIAVEDGERVAGVAAYRTRDGRPFTDDDLAFCDLLVPHLRRAYELSRELCGSRSERFALADVVDRLSIGVIVVDEQRRALITNRQAEAILRANDGFFMDDDGPHAVEARDDAAIQQLMAAALAPSRGQPRQQTGVTAITRPSGRRLYSFFVAPLLELSFEPFRSDARAVIFVGDPDVSPFSATHMLQNLYRLTPAEAELVQLLATGCSLEEAAARRGVTRNTARSQLKQVFAKTDTRRQGELVRLVLTGITSMSDK